MSISLNDLAANNSTNETKNKVQAVSVADITSVKSEPDTNLQAGYIETQFNALDGLIGQAKVAREQFDASHANETVEANLEDFDPEDLEGPVIPTPSTTNLVSDSSPIKMKEKEPVSNNIENASTDDNKTTEDTTSTEETIPESPVVEKKETVVSNKKKIAKEAKEEQEFNNIFDDDEDDDLRKIINGDNSSDDDDQEEQEAPKLSEEEEKKIVDEYKKTVTDFYTSKRVSVNTSGFKVSNKSISISSLLNIKEPDKRVSDWVQTTAKKPFSTVEYKGLELQKINPSNVRNRNAINAKKEIYRTIYNHLVGATKDGFESWLKSTPYSDVNQYYFGAYKATFGDLNVITYQCPNTDCNHLFVTEQPIESMYEIDEDFKDEFNKIFNGDTSLVVNNEEEIIPVSDQFAIGWYSEPSIYSIEIEPLLIDQETQEKYARIISLIPFISRMYFIDVNKGEFIPIDESPVAKNLAKTVKNKLAIYYNILNSLSTDQLAAPQLRVYNYTQKEDKIKFFEPECKCPKCGRIIEKQPTNAVTLLFNRAQSPLAANS